MTLIAGPKGSISPIHCEIGTGIAHSTTVEANATSSASCVCQRYHYNSVADGGLSCGYCPIGTICDTPGLTLTTLRLKVGYYRPGAHSIDVRRCPDAADGCAATGVALCAESTSTCRGGDNATAQCSAGFTGVFCKLCAEHGAIRQSGRGASGEDECVLCEEDGTLGRHAASLCGVLSALALALLVLRAVRRLLPRSAVSLLVRLWRACKPANKIKITIGYCARAQSNKACSLAGTARLARQLLSASYAPCASLLSARQTWSSPRWRRCTLWYCPRRFAPC